MLSSVLILRLSALGDVAMTIPVIYSLARQYPQLCITVATRPFFRRLFINAPANIDFVEVDTAGAHKGVHGLARLIGELRQRHFTCVADLHDMLRTRLITAALRVSGAKVATVDKARSARRLLTVEKSREFQPNYIDRYADVFRRLGFPVEVNFRSLLPEPERREGIGIAPFARYATKTYPPELMEQVVRLLTDAGERVLLFGARGAEAEQLRQWAGRNPALEVVAGTLTLEQELEAMSRLRAMVSMDSANMHLASLVATPVVSVWGSTVPQCGFMGYGQSPANAVCLYLPCQPCSIAGRPACPLGTLACLRTLPPQQIVDKV